MYLFFWENHGRIHRVGYAVLLLIALQLHAQAPGNPPASKAPQPFARGVSPPASIELASVRGPASAPVTIVEFADFECPFCGRAASGLEELLQQESDNVRLVFKHNPLPIHPHARLAHEAALAAAAQGKFWEMHDLLFVNQKHLERADLLQYARQLHLDTDAFERALDDRTYAPFIDRDLAEAQGLGIRGTPTFFINGRQIAGVQSVEQWKTLIHGPSTSTPRIRLEDIKTEGAPVRGPASAPVTIVEFSDFQCPFCARALPIVKEVMDAYPGQIKWVFKNYPLDFHAAASLAHRAAMAAFHQERFWEMHDLLFANQHALGRDDLLRYAQQLNLDMKRFQADLDSPNAMMEADKNEGQQLGISGTPTFFVNGKMLVGAQPLEAFSKIIESRMPAAAQIRLKEAHSPNSSQLNAGTVPPATTNAASQRYVQASRPIAAAITNDDSRFSLGPKQATVTVDWFVDLQSPLSIKANEMVRKLVQDYPGKIRVVFKHLPLEIHHDALLAHEATLAAGEQGKFWEMEQAILSHQQALKRADLLSYAVQIGLNQEKFATAIDSGKYRPAINADLAEARYRDIRGTPVFFVNGKRLDGLQSELMFKSYIDGELQATMPAEVVASVPLGTPK